MKRIGVGVLVILSLLQAGIAELENLYIKKDYAGVVALAQTLKGDFENPLVHLLWAKSAQALGKNDEAISAYERVLIIDETNTEAQRALYELYVKTFREELALELAQKFGIKSFVKNETLLKAKATLAYGYDTNSNMSATASDLNEYLGSAVEGVKESFFTRLHLGLRFKEPLEESGKWHLEGNFQTMQQRYQSASHYDMNYGSLGIGIGYEGENYKVSLPLSFSKMDYLDTDLFDEVRFEPSVSINVRDDLIVTLSTPYVLRNYLPKQYDSMSHSSLGFGGSMYYMYEQNYYYASLLYENIGASKSDPNYFVDRKNIHLAVGTHLALRSPFLFDGEYRYKKGSYEDGNDLKNPASSAKRGDDLHQIDVKLSYPFGEYFSAYFSQRLTHNDSNYLLANYEKSVSMFGVGVSY